MAWAFSGSRNVALTSMIFVSRGIFTSRIDFLSDESARESSGSRTFHFSTACLNRLSLEAKWTYVFERGEIVRADGRSGSWVGASGGLDQDPYGGRVSLGYQQRNPQRQNDGGGTGNCGQTPAAAQVIPGIDMRQTIPASEVFPAVRAKLQILLVKPASVIARIRRSNPSD